MRPLEAYLIFSRRLEPGFAAEIVQDFVVSRVVERDLLERSDRCRGRLRNLLLTSLNHFLIDQLRRSTREPHLGIDLDASETAAQIGASAAFDQALAREVLQHTLARMQSYCTGADMTRTWELFEAHVVNPILFGSSPLSYQCLVTKFGFGTPVEVANALTTGKRVFRRLLQQALIDFGLQDAAESGGLQELMRNLSGQA